MATYKINRGTTFPITVRYSVDGVATSLVGATIFFTCKAVEYDSDNTDSSAVIPPKTITTHLDAPSGISEILIEPSDTITMTPENDYYYDIKVKNADGTIYKLDEGKIKIDASPTNRTS